MCERQIHTHAHTRTFHPFSPGDLSTREPLDPIPNSIVKPRRAYDRVSITHAKVGHRQATFTENLIAPDEVFFWSSFRYLMRCLGRTLTATARIRRSSVPLIE